MAALDTFLARLLPRFTSCSDPQGRQALLDAAIEFCEKTEVVQVVTDPVDAVSGTAEYALSLGTGVEAVDILAGWFGTRPLYRAADTEINTPLAYTSSVYSADAATGEPTDVYFYNSAARVYPVPDATYADALTFKCSVKPTDTATTVPDALLKWRDAIVEGATARLAVITGSPMYNLDQAKIAAERFYAEINRARIRGVRGRASGDVRVRLRPFA